VAKCLIEFPNGFTHNSILDSGASKTLTSASFTKHLEIHPSLFISIPTSTLRLADGRRAVVEQQVHLEFRLPTGERGWKPTFSHMFLIVPGLFPGIILGCDFLSFIGAKVHFEKKHVCLLYTVPLVFTNEKLVVQNPYPSPLLLVEDLKLPPYSETGKLVEVPPTENLANATAEVFITELEFHDSLAVGRGRNTMKNGRTSLSIANFSPNDVVLPAGSAVGQFVPINGEDYEVFFVEEENSDYPPLISNVKMTTFAKRT